MSPSTVLYVISMTECSTTSMVDILFPKNASTTIDHVKSMEIKLCAFIAEQDLAISLSDDLLSFYDLCSLKNIL